MIWSLALDDFKGTVCGQGKYPLISFVKETLDTGGKNGPVNRTAFPTLAPRKDSITTQSTIKGPGSLLPRVLHVI